MQIYFFSKILQQSEVNYPPIEKLVYALTHTARRLMRYFQAHSILVLTDQPIKQILKNPESSGHLANNYVWELHTDGASTEEGVGARLVLTSPEGEEHTYALKFCFYASNNEAEYEALLSGLRIATEMGIKQPRAYVDSQIVAQQVNGAFEVKDVSMKQYLQLIEKISKKFETLEVLVEVLKDKSIDEKVVVAIFEEGESCWMTPYMIYLQDGTLPTDVTEARRIKQAIDVVREMHEGLYAHHSGYRTVVRWIMRQGYYWQTIYRDTAEVIKTCDACQRHGTVQCLPKYDLISASSTWPFCKWAIDIVGPFPRSVGNANFLVVAIDFFSKWVVAKVLARMMGENIKKFVWNDIICRYGLPNEIVSDNGKQFADNPFRSWCEELNIKQTFTSVAHPQANGQVEVTNKEMLADIKARLGLSQTKWVDELPYVLWAHCTTPKGSRGETPFSLVYGTEAVIPAEIRVPVQRILPFDTESNSSVLRENLFIRRKANHGRYPSSGC
ncbi:uncharacterized protein [Rutidosis leptorrhynchoides]|uniref:uncharacterized protein n=1 Tax=Rutidosis leptorrhynchoides TaxID=125765 RepID=UPI003A993549